MNILGHLNMSPYTMLNYIAIYYYYYYYLQINYPFSFISSHYLSMSFSEFFDIDIVVELRPISLDKILSFA